MADINLLQNQLIDTTYVSYRRTLIVFWVTIFILFFVVAGCVGYYFMTQTTNDKIGAIAHENTNLQNEINKQELGLKDAQAYQAQLSNIELLLKNHIYFSPLLAELEKYTYLRAQFHSVDVLQQTGRIHLEGSVESYNALGKLLLGLSTSPNFVNVKLLAVLPSAEKNSGYTFSIDMIGKPNLFTNNSTPNGS